MTFKIDRKEELRLLAAFEKQPVHRILEIAAQEGAKAAQQVVRAAAPVGRSSRPSQYYRRHRLGHGTLRGSVQIAPATAPAIGYVVAPMGTEAFARAFVERRTHWLEKVASKAFSRAQEASEAVLALYAKQAGK